MPVPPSLNYLYSFSGNLQMIFSNDQISRGKSVFCRRLFLSSDTTKVSSQRYLLSLTYICKEQLLDMEKNPDYTRKKLADFFRGGGKTNTKVGSGSVGLSWFLCFFPERICEPINYSQRRYFKNVKCIPLQVVYPSPLP